MVDTLASEYAWTSDYILHRVDPLQAFSLFPKIAQRQKNAFIDQLEINIMTDTNIQKAEDRQRWLNSVDALRTETLEGPPERPLDRNKLDQLRKVMGKRKGKAPQRVK